MSIEERLRHTLRRRAGTITMNPDALRMVEDRLARRRTRQTVVRSILSGAITLMVVAATVGGLWIAFRPADDGGPAEPAGPAGLELQATAIPVGPSPNDVAAGEGAIWVSVGSGSQSQADAVLRIDPASNQVQARIEVDEPLQNLVVGGGSVWGTFVKGDRVGPDASTLVQIDARTNQVEAVVPGLAGPTAFGAGTLWATASAEGEGRTLVRLDPTTREIVAAIPLEVVPWSVSVGDGAAWVLPLEGDTILKVDVESSEVVASFQVPTEGSVYPPVAGEGVLWVPIVTPEFRAVVLRLDASTGQSIGDEVSVPAATPFGLSEGRLWILDEKGGVWGLNTDTLQVDESVVYGDPPRQTTVEKSAVVDSQNSVIWIASYRDSVVRVDLHT